MKRFLALILALVLAFSLVACGGKKGKEEAEEPSNPDIVMVTDESKLGDNGFNDACWAGCEKAAEDFKLEIYCIEADDSDDYKASLSEAVLMEPQLIICAGSNMQYVLMDVASQHPEQKFAIIDANELGENVAGITFKEQDGAFLAGVVAAMTTEAKIVSFIGGEMSVTLDRFQYGYEAGIATVDKNIYINNQYLGTISDAEQAQTIAGAHAALGSDVIFGVAGAANKGVIEAAKLRGSWVIGVDIDQSGLAPETVLCSMIKKADVAAYDVISKVVDGTFDGADVEYSMLDDALGISDDAGNLPEEVMKAVEEYAEKIKNGEIVVPYDWQTCYDYRALLD